MSRVSTRGPVGRVRAVSWPRSAGRGGLWRRGRGRKRRARTSRGSAPRSRRSRSSRAGEGQVNIVQVAALRPAREGVHGGKRRCTSHVPEGRRTLFSDMISFIGNGGVRRDRCVRKRHVRLMATGEVAPIKRGTHPRTTLTSTTGSRARCTTASIGEAIGVPHGRGYKARCAWRTDEVTARRRRAGRRSGTTQTTTRGRSRSTTTRS